MNLIALELPEDEAQWPTWLERQVVGMELRTVVRQLEAMSGGKHSLPEGQTWAERLDELFAEQLPAVLENGLGVLEQDLIRSLIQQPRLLLALQERVLIKGGQYWQTVPLSAEHQQVCETIRSRVLQSIRPESQSSSGSPGPDSAPKKSPSKAGGWTVSRRQIIGLVAVAAGVLFAFLAWPKEGRFFSRPGLLTSSLMGREFSKSIAEAIRNDWQSNAPPAKYVRQLQALHDSCETFLDAPLDQLNPLIAVDLKNRCRNWQSSLNQLLRDLDEGRSFDEVRTEANALVERLTNVIESLG